MSGDPFKQVFDQRKAQKKAQIQVYNDLEKNQNLEAERELRKQRTIESQPQSAYVSTPTKAGPHVLNRLASEKKQDMILQSLIN